MFFSFFVAQMILPIAEHLRIPSHRVFANNILFNEADGAYASFDASAPTSRDGGKRTVVQKLIDDHGYSGVVMIGDGATDMQARPPASAFIGYGGIVVREKVKEGADWFISDFKVRFFKHYFDIFLQ
jgi:phosphoserine phosphatase